MKVNINRQLAGLEDIAFGTGTVMQERQGKMVEITKVNLGNLPFSETLSAAEVLTPIYEQVVPHMAEILEADTNAAIAAAKAVEAADSAAAALASEQAVATSEGFIASHLIAEDNPHSVTKAQVGLSNVDNTSDADKPVSTAQQAALDDKSDDNAVMHLASDETISGIKTFLASPIVPDATTPQQPLALGQVSTVTALAIHNAPLKAIPDDLDELGIWDSVLGLLKSLSFTDLITYLTGIFAPLASPAFTGTPTAPTPSVGDNGTSIATTAFVKAKSELDSVGVGQTLTDVTTSRAVNVGYVNSTGKPIMVMVVFGSSIVSVLYGYINATIVWRASIGVGGYNNTYVALIQNGASYGINASGGTVSISSWYEIR